MGLFRRRPLCFFCLMFFVGALFAWFANRETLLWGIGMVGGLVALLIVALTAIRRYRIPLLTALIGTVLLLSALAQSFLAIAMPRYRASQYVGEEQAVLVTVLSEQYRSEYSATYQVRVRQLGEETVSVRGHFVCDAKAEIGTGDELAAVVTVSEATPSKDGALLELYLNDPAQARIRRLDPDKPLWEIVGSPGGLTILSQRMRQAVGARLTELLGEEQGSLASGFLMGDTGDLPSEILRDFRRSGTSHQMAVSGMHIAILLGGIELLLRKLGMPKKGRCLTVSLFSVLFLCLTGFSASACRSVLMLYAVYLGYLFSEESDGVTSLFVSVTLILLISPYSVADLGLWMSFLATLGLLTVYPIFERKIPLPKKKRGIGQRVLRFLRRCLLLMLMTVIANVFLLPVSWLFFRELSLVAVASNLLLSPLCYLFLPGIPLVLALSFVPWVGSGLAWLLGAVGRVMLWCVGQFSRLPNATLSLNYGFVDWIMIGFTVSFVLLLVLPLRRQWLVGIPPVAAVLLFTVCFVCYHGMNPIPTVTYAHNGYGRELITVREKTAISFCDISDGGWGSYREMKANYEDSVATEIESVTVTHLRDDHLPVLELLMRQVRVRRLYLPRQEAERVPELGQVLWQIGQSCGTEIILFEREDRLVMTETVRAVCATLDTDAHCSLCLSVYAGQTAVTYVSPNACHGEWAESVSKRMGMSNTVFFGSHGMRETDFYWFSIPDSKTEQIVFSRHDLVGQCALSGVTAEIFAPKTEKECPEIQILLP